MPMQMQMLGPMGLTMLLCALVVLALVAAAVYLGMRLARRRGTNASARAILDRRFAAGELGAEEYYERESALRSTATTTRKRRLGLSGT